MKTKSSISAQRIAYASCLFAALLVCASVAAQSTGQSLDQQYTFFLSAKCDEMNFTRDGFFNLLPGQAGPRLNAYCSGLPPVGGALSNAASGGGAGVTAGSAADDSARRRRRSVAAENEPQEQEIALTENAGVFVSLDHARERQKTTQFEGGRDTDMLGATLGIDYRFGSRGLIGLATRFEKTTGDFDSGGDYRTTSRGLTAYASWLPVKNAFIDINAGMNFRSDTTHRTVALARIITFLDGSQTASVEIPAAAVNSDKDSSDFRAQLQGGYDFVFGGYSLGPRLGVTTAQLKLDGYVENGNTPMTLIFNEQTEDSLRSAVGVQGSRVFALSSSVVIAQLNFDWHHEFQDDQRTITARFAEDLRPNPTVLQFLNEAPDRDAFNARLSVSVIFRNGFSGFVAVESLFGHTYLSRNGVSLGVRKEF